MNSFMEQLPSVRHRALAIPLAAWLEQAIGIIPVQIAHFWLSIRKSRRDRHQELRAPLELQVAHTIAGGILPGRPLN